MKLLFKVIIIISIPIGLIILVNKTNKTPTNAFFKNKCSRVCHNKTCSHFNSKANSSNPFSVFQKNIYDKNIKLLKKNPFGVSYKSINIVNQHSLFGFFEGALDVFIHLPHIRKCRSYLHHILFLL